MSELINMDCRDYLPTLKENSIDMVFTSPPYHDKDGFSPGFIMTMAQELYRVQKRSGIAFINFGSYRRDPMRPINVMQWFVQAGYIWQDTIIWVKSINGKGHFTPINSDHMLNDMWEYIFVFSKSTKRKLDRLAIGEPYTDKNNIKRFSGNNIRCAGNIWHIPHETISRQSDRNHVYQFPSELPRRAIKLAGLKPGSMILDPCAGSGIVGQVADEFGFNSICLEKNDQVCDNSLLRGVA